MELTPPDIHSRWQQRVWRKRAASLALPAICRVCVLRTAARAACILMSLQYTATAEHFVEAFRPSILGAFHASPQDGNLRIDYTQHPVCAMVQYLDAVAE